MSRVVEHEPDWTPAMLPYNAAGDTKPGFECQHMLENGNGRCGGNVFEIEQEIGNHCIVIGWTLRDLRWRIRTWNWTKHGTLPEYR